MPRFQAPTLNGKSTDIILRSRDSVDYALHASVLAERSPVFRDMLELGSDLKVDSEDAAKVIPMLGEIETAPVLDIVLPFVYACEDPDELAAAPINLVLKAARTMAKFDIRGLKHIGYALVGQAALDVFKLGVDLDLRILVEHTLPELVSLVLQKDPGAIAAAQSHGHLKAIELGAKAGGRSALDALLKDVREAFCRLRDSVCWHSACRYCTSSNCVASALPQTVLFDDDLVAAERSVQPDNAKVACTCGTCSAQHKSQLKMALDQLQPAVKTWIVLNSAGNRYAYVSGGASDLHSVIKDL